MAVHEVINTYTNTLIEFETSLTLSSMCARAETREHSVYRYTVLDTGKALEGLVSGDLSSHTGNNYNISKYLGPGEFQTAGSRKWGVRWGVDERDVLNEHAA